MAERSRKWLVTINNPKEKGMTHERIKEILCNLHLIYWCMSDEIGEMQTSHTHLYLQSGNAIKFKTIKQLYPDAHIDFPNGTAKQNREYVFKEGKWLEDAKGDTNIRDTHEEYGECPVERQGRRTDLDELYDMIKSGMPDDEIIEENPQYIDRLEKLDRVRQTLKMAQYKNTWRDVTVTYVYGKTGTGKTRNIMEQYGYENVYRVTDYIHPFDSYKGQDVIVFEEYRSSIKIADILNYLDGYPLELPCRYSNKAACYTVVYIVTNIMLEEQYKEVQKEHAETWEALLRRIDLVKVYDGNKIMQYTLDEYMNGFKKIHITPFDM